MDSRLKRGLFLVTLAGAITIPARGVQAAPEETTELPSVGIGSVLEECYASEENIEVENYLVPAFKGEYSNMAFAKVSSYLYIRSEPDAKSEWVGKLYPDYAANITGPVGEWTPVESGNVVGYVKTEYIYIGNEAEEKAQEIIRAAAEADDLEENNEEVQAQQTAVTEAPEGDEQEIAKDVFSYAESKEEEEQRILEEQQALKEAIAEIASGGQAVVDYACQFIGNPYVWGGTSLTNGADCSGFVQSVYGYFGVSLPRTSGEQRSAGTGISYEEAIPGDIICYDGHVGIYIGDGQIVNAINSRSGIGITSATYANILAVRRVL